MFTVIKKCIVLLLLLSKCAVSFVLAQDTLKLGRNNLMRPLSIAEHAHILEDSNQNFSFLDVVNHPGFQENSTARVKEQIGSTYWLKFIVKNQDEMSTDWLLSFSSIDIFKIEIYTPSTTEETVFPVVSLGNIYPFDKRPLSTRAFSYPFILEPDEVKAFYVYLDHRHQLLSTIISLQTLRMAYETTQKENFFNGIVIGGATIYLLAALMLFLNYRRLINVYFIIYLLGGILYLLGSSGYGFMFIWPSIPLFQDASPYVGLAILLTGYTGMFREFFNVDSHYKNIGHIFLAFTYFFPLLAMGFLAWPYLILFNEKIYYTLYIVEAFACITCLILSFWVGFKIYRKTGNKEYFWFMSVFVILFITSFFILLTELTPFPKEDHILFILLICTIFYEATILSLFLIRRIYVEKLFYQKKVIEERGRIVEDLHDEVISSIGGVKISFGILSRKTPDPILQYSFHTLDKKISKVVDQIRDLSKDLKSDSIELASLVAELNRYANEQFEMIETNLNFQFTTTRRQIILPLILRRNLKAFFKEAIHNCIKYAKAQNCWIQIEQSDDWIYCLIKDDGQGFNHEEGLLHPIGDGNGLRNFQKRAQKMRAEFTLSTSPGRGVEIRLSINLLNFNQLDFALENIP